MVQQDAIADLNLLPPLAPTVGATSMVGVAPIYRYRKTSNKCRVINIDAEGFEQYTVQTSAGSLVCHKLEARNRIKAKA